MNLPDFKSFSLRLYGFSILYLFSSNFENGKGKFKIPKFKELWFKLSSNLIIDFFNNYLRNLNFLKLIYLLVNCKN